MLLKKHCRSIFRMILFIQSEETVSAIYQLFFLALFSNLITSSLSATQPRSHLLVNIPLGVVKLL